MTKKTFATAQAAREYLVGLGFAPFKKGLTKAALVAPNGKKAWLGYGIKGRT